MNNFYSQTLKFPVIWSYRIIGISNISLKKDIQNVLLQFQIKATIRTSHSSKTGQYQSYFVDIPVESKEQMNSIATALQSLPNVKFVL